VAKCQKDGMKEPTKNKRRLKVLIERKELIEKAWQMKRVQIKVLKMKIE
jgi:hypothetical protein